MNKVAVVKAMLVLAKDLTSGKHDQWDEILELTRKKKRYGEEEMVNFIAEVWNGGISQWVLNGNLDDLATVKDIARHLGPIGNEMVKKVSDISDTLQELLDMDQERNDDEDRANEIQEELDVFDSWFYNGNDAKIVAAFLDYLKGE